MGARNRRKRAIARQVESARAAAGREFGDDTPMMRDRALAVAESSVRRPESMPPLLCATPDHVWERMASGRQYVKGDRAPRVMLTRTERSMNAEARRQQSRTRKSYRVKVTEYGIKRTVGQTTGRVVASEPVSRETRRVAGKRVRDGEGMTPRTESAVEHSAAIVGGRVFVKSKDWRTVTVRPVSE